MSRTGQAPIAPAETAAILVTTRGMAPGTRFHWHTHPQHQLAWAPTGVLIAVAGEGTWVLPPTRALWIPARVPHEISCHGRATMRALYLRPKLCPITWSQPQPVSAGPLLAELINHVADPGLDPLRRARAEAVLIDNLEPVSRATIDAPMPTDDRAADVARALLDEPRDPRSLDQWGSHVGASARTLARAFADGTGIPFGRWRTAVRLRAALPYLAAGESVARVARRVGYGTPSAFVAAFRRETGLTPGGYFRPDRPGP
jgi:AraC-like DNA-binding protein/quercetin dioxygenase-like cupin family protein